ncbi:type II toxin-antitoxin system VapC family toxin [Cytobacillus firmus]|uniref:type II toxin-antitoxin system VapC family toxin n=1 Tax=Cytobacillus firmus TaxID=1399 RepID=UPI00300180C2
MSNVIHISKYEPTEEDSFFFDANIWMHLFCSVGDYSHRNVNAYNSFFQKVLEANSKIYTTSMVLSEFFNAYCKVEYHITRGNKSLSEYSYKHNFRRSQEFEDLMGLIQNIVKNRILKNTSRLNDNFENINIDLLFNEPKDFDFNDQYFLEICKNHSICILTHDKDFLKNTNHDVIILTNHKMSH